MRVKRNITILIAMALMVLSLVGCSQKIEGPFIGSWSYIHDEENIALLLKDNGKAVLDGIDYTYTVSEPYLVFKSKDGTETKMRYVMDDEEMIFYKPNVYEFSGEGKPEGLVGVWKDPKDKWSFEFTAEGTFMEDGYFPGYFIDNGDGSIKMVYNDQFPDATMYYSIEGNELLVEYPWTMIKFEK